MESPKVSILIPVYNASRYIEKCLDSVVAQTYTNLHVAIVDDGSTDNSLAICRRYESKYPFVEVFHQDNHGVGYTRNQLLKHIKGECFLFVDADDWIEPDMIEKLVEMLTKHDLDIAVCSKVIENGNGVTEIVRGSKNLEIWDKERCIKEFLYHKNINGTLWNKLIRNDIAQGVSFDPSVSYGEDALFIWRCLPKVNRIGLNEDTLYHYNLNPNSISHEQFGSKKMSGHKVWSVIYADTCLYWPQYKYLAQSAFAISDMWLLFYAACDKYPFNENIRIYQRNVRKNLLGIAKADYIKFNKKLFALGMAISYKLGAIMIRKYL